MAEAALLRARDGREIPASADVRRIGRTARTVRALALGGGGLILGAASILIPGAHFVLPWLLPSIGIATAIYVSQRTAVVGRIRSTCPGCATPIDTPGGPLGADPLWVRCPGCQIPLLYVEGMPEAGKPA